MTTQLDVSVGFGLETVYGTPVAQTRNYEFVDESLDWQPNFVQGVGLRVGSRASRSGRRALGKQMVGGDLDLECVSKGMGYLWNSALGVSASTMVSTGIFQQVHSVLTQDYLPSYTIQKGVPLLGSATTKQHTFAGCQTSAFTLSVTTGGILMLKSSFVGKAVDTTTALGANAYAASPQIFTFAGGAITVGGSVTLPTTTALATGGTAVADIRDFSVTWNNNLDGGGFTFGNSGSRGRPAAVGLAAGTGKITAEFDTTTVRDAFLGQNDLAMVLNFTASTLISGSTFPTIQVVIPEFRFEGELPKSSNTNGDVITLSSNFTILDGLVAPSPLYIVQVTSDTAL